MSNRQQLRHSIHVILKGDNRGSHSTRACRRNIILDFAEDLYKLGIHLTDIRQLKSKHIEKVVADWIDDELMPGTMKNRMSALRQFCRLISKDHIIKTNDEYGIPKRNYYPTYNKAIFNADLSQVEDEHLRISLELQRVFGLRREECMKMKPYIADLDHTLRLLPAWTKGNRGRFVPIRTDEQRHWLDQAKSFVKRKGYSLIPRDKNYKKHKDSYDNMVKKIGLKNPHGLRHAYAQLRFRELTGFEAPINGGPSAKELTPEQKELDFTARTILAEELGHSRRQVTVSYCG